MNDRNVNIVVWCGLRASDRDQCTCSDLRKRSTWSMNYYYFCLCAFFLHFTLCLNSFFRFSCCRPVFSYSVPCGGTSETTKNHIDFFSFGWFGVCVCVRGRELNFSDATENAWRTKKKKMKRNRESS